MQVTPTGQSEYHDGNEVLRYGRDISRNETFAVWYHDGLRKYDEPAWAMYEAVEWKISVSTDAILAACQDGLYRIDRDELREAVECVDGDEQLVARASDDFVSKIGDPNEHLHGHLWIESGNQIDEGYHQQQNHA